MGILSKLVPRRKPELNVRAPLPESVADASGYRPTTAMVKRYLSAISTALAEYEAHLANQVSMIDPHLRQALYEDCRARQRLMLRLLKNANSIMTRLSRSRTATLENIIGEIIDLRQAAVTVSNIQAGLQAPDFPDWAQRYAHTRQTQQTQLPAISEHGSIYQPSVPSQYLGVPNAPYGGSQPSSSSLQYAAGNHLQVPLAGANPYGSGQPSTSDFQYGDPRFMGYAPSSDSHWRYSDAQASSQGEPHVGLFYQ